MKKFGIRILFFLVLTSFELLAQNENSTIVLYRYKNNKGENLFVKFNNSESLELKPGGKIEYKKQIQEYTNLQIFATNSRNEIIIKKEEKVFFKPGFIYYLHVKYFPPPSAALQLMAGVYMPPKLEIEVTKEIEKSNKLLEENFISTTDIIAENRSDFANHPKTKWDKVLLKEHWESNKADQIEGIYEFLEDNVNNKSSMKYEIGVIKEEDNYKIVNLSGDIPNWTAGELKGELIKTAQFGVFKGVWYMNNKTKEDDIIITFDGLLMKSLFNKHNVITKYMKLYPTYSDKAISEKSSFSTGTGFFFLKNGYLITNYHVVENSKEVKVLYKNIEYKAKVAYKDKTNDVAIVKIEDEKFIDLDNIEYNFKTESVDIGTYVFTLGFPLTNMLGEDIKFTDGKISSKSGMDGQKSNYQISVPIQPGNSGGPLFDENCNLIGITTSTVNRRLDMTENVNFAIKTSYVNLLLDEMEETIELPKYKVNEKLSIQDKIKILTKYVALIKCEL